MEVTRILAEIDSQIEKLQQARELLAGNDGAKRVGRGRPKGSKNGKAVDTASATAPMKTRKLSPEGRKRIAEAMKRRWAERRKATQKA